MSLNTNTHIEWTTLSVASVLPKVNKQITNFFISAALEITYFPVFGLFEEWMETHLFGCAPLKIANGVCFLHFFYFLGCVLEETHDTTYIKVGSQVLNGRNCMYIDVIVIELYVIKSWWIIKLNNRRIHQLVFFHSTSTK